MKHLFIVILYLLPAVAFTQTLQLHYDLRHTVNPDRNAKNFPSVYFEYFKTQTDTESFIKPGSFLFKMETDMQGDQNNIGKAYMQITQTFRCWKFPVFIGVQYSGGLGVTEPKQYSYYISNSFGIGPNYPFQWKGGYFSAAIYYTKNLLKKPSNDLMFSFYWWKGFFNYKLEVAGDIELYTLNKNPGGEPNQSLTGKTTCFFGEPQFWYNLNRAISFGSKQLLFYHVNTSENIFEIYPTVAIRVKI
ncbi:MAG TPA: DUF5020 family protein [Mucilaginibacter sp.]|nr:DUF5020 family protein [Mucilaginibacter sp.]